MVPPRDVLLIDVGIPPMQVLAARLQQLGFRAIRVKSPSAARETLVDPRYRIGAVVVPPDLPASNLAAALQRLRELAPSGELCFLVSGFRPDVNGRARLRGAGVEFGLWDPIDSHTLRFLLNRAMSGAPTLRTRNALRVPADWPVRVSVGGREKPARIYSLSSAGAFLATSRPSVRQAELGLTLPLPTGPVRAVGEVVMTNVPGNLMRHNLPVGMGVRFTAKGSEAEQALLDYVEERMRAIGV